MHFYLSVTVFSPKVLIADTIFLCLQLETGPPFNMVIRATQKSTRLHCNGLEYLHFLVILLFKTLSIGPAPEIEPATSCSAVKRSTDWANPAVEQLCIGFTCRNFGPCDAQVEMVQRGNK